MASDYMDETPTDSEPSAKQEDAPEEADPKLRRIAIGAAEACRERFDEAPSHDAHQLAEILDALGRYRHLIDAVYRFMGSEDCPPKREPTPAPVIAIGGVPIRRPVVSKDGSVVYQKTGKGRQWEGPSMVRKTAVAIEEYSDPLDVAVYVIRHLPPLMRADCRDANRDPAEVGLAIESLLAGEGTTWPGKRWRDPEAVLRAILRDLGHPRPDNVTRDG